MKLTTRFALLSLALAFSANANAALIFEILRTSDTTAEITASGTFDTTVGPNNGHILMFDDVFSFTSVGNPRFGDASGIGYDSGVSFDWLYGLGPDREAQFGGDLYMFSATPSAGWTISGTALLDASATDWILNSVGHTGNVYSGMPGGNVAGTFRIIGDSASVPEPGSLALLGLGLAGLGFARRRKTA